MTGNISEILVAHAKEFPERIALRHLGRKLTYGELHGQVIRTASYLRKKGIAKGDRVLVFVPFSISLYRILLALFYMGATAVFLDAWAGRKRLENAVQIADCQVLIGIPKAHLLRLVSKEIRRIPVKLTPWLPKFSPG